METPDRQGRDAGGNAIIAAATDRQDGGETVGHPCRQIPGAKAAHREARKVDTCWIDLLSRDRLLECLSCRRQVDGGRGGLRRALRVGPRDIHPAFVHAALWCEHVARVPLARGRLGQPRGQILQLLGVVAAAFASPMQKEHDGIPEAIEVRSSSGIGSKQAIAEFDRRAPVGDADRSFLVERCGVGIGSGGDLVDSWYGLHRCFLGAGRYSSRR